MSAPTLTHTEWRVCHRRNDDAGRSSWRTRFYAVEATARAAATSSLLAGHEVRLQCREATPWLTVPNRAEEVQVGEIFRSTHRDVGGADCGGDQRRRLHLHPRVRSHRAAHRGQRSGGRGCLAPAQSGVDMSENGWEAKARLEKAIAIEHALRNAGCTTTELLDALDGGGRRNAEAAAGLVRASAETWSEVRRLFLDYDAGRAAVGNFE